MNSFFSSIAFFIIIEIMFILVFQIRYLFYKNLFGKIDRVIFFIASLVFLVISFYIHL